MIDLSYLAIAVAAVVAFVLSTVYYIAFGEQLRRLSPAAAGITDWIGAVQFGLGLWIGFPMVLWLGAIIWENVPVRLAALHAGDWLVKVVVLSIIVSIWR